MVGGKPESGGLAPDGRACHYIGMSKTDKPVLLIDVDGVILTGTPPWWIHLERDFGFDKASLHRFFFAPYWADIVTGKDDLTRRLSQALRAMDAQVSAAELRDYWFAKDATANPEMLRWIGGQREAGHKVMLATNQDHSRAAYLMDRVDLGACCDGIYYSAALGVAKPDPQFFQMIAAREGRPCRDLILIDDTAENVAAARDAGLTAHHFTGLPPASI